MERIWDKDGKYPAGFVRSFNYWTFEISYRQHTLGSFIIFSNAYHESISELTGREAGELPRVAKYIENLYRNITILNPDKFNYLQLGNQIKHLHFHGIPRYKDSRRFAGKVWKDMSFGNPPVWSPDDEGDELIIALKNLVASSFP